MRTTERARRLLPVVTSLGLLAALVSGCARESEPAFVQSEELLQLPEAHRLQITETLTRLFGNPINPRLAIPESDDVETLVDLVDPARLQHGAAVFNLRCAGCHGTTGDGNGAAAGYLQPKPRDYRRGIFKFTSTPYGAKPNRADLVRIVRRGAKGTSMPAFPFLPDEDVRDVVRYVTMLSYRGEVEATVVQVTGFDYGEDEAIDEFEFVDAAARIHESWQQAEHQTVLPVTAQQAYDDASILAGRAAFLSRGCSQCHGQDARGQTAWLSHEFIAEQESRPEAEREQINYDVWGDPAPAADLTARMLHGGRRPIDIYRRIYTGINGTPMPAFHQALAEEPEAIWHLVHYVLSVVEGREVEGLAEITVPSANGQANAEGEN